MTLFLLSAAVALTLWRVVTDGASADTSVGWVSWLALGAIFGLWLWSRLSTGWSADADAALIGSDGWLLDALALGLAVLLIRSDHLAGIGVAVVSVVIIAFALYLIVRLAGSGGPSLLEGGRLYLPVGYVPAESGFLLLGVWPLVGLAEQFKRFRSGLSLGAATAIVAIALLGQSRSAEFAAVGSAAVLLLIVPGRARRFWALAVMCGAIWLMSSPILAVYSRYEAGGNGAVRLGPAMVAALCAGLIAGALWTAVGEFAQIRRRALDRLARYAAGAAVLAMAALGGVLHSRIGHEVSKIWHDFVTNSSTGVTANRFATGGGDRHEYWRVALDEFKSHILNGVGADNYLAGWMRLRHISEDINQPHSIEFQTLAELGLVGGLLLAALIIAAVAGVVRHGRRSSLNSGLPYAARRRSRLVAVGGGGVFLVWLGESSVDWLHLFPAATGLAFIGLAAVLAPVGSGVASGHAVTAADAARPALAMAAGAAEVASERALNRRRRGLAGAGTALLLAFGVMAAIGVARPMLANHQEAEAQTALRSDAPSQALGDVSQALKIDSRSLNGYYIAAAADARLDEYAPARLALLAAARIDPQAFATWLLLGDIAVRHGNLAEARAAYTRAVALDPLETEFNGSLPATG